MRKEAIERFETQKTELVAKIDQEMEELNAL
jgi:hypothetical protein